MNLNKLKDFAATIKHCGDYGELFVNPDSNEVWWVAGDGDFNSDQIDAGLTTESVDILKGFKITGVKNVFIEAECGPPEDEGWISLGKFGIDNWEEVNDYYDELL